MRLSNVVRLKRSTVVIVAILLLFSVSVLLVTQLDVVLLDDVTQHAGVGCSCASQDSSQSGGLPHPVHDVMSVTRVYQAATTNGTVAHAQSVPKDASAAEAGHMISMLSRMKNNWKVSVNDTKRTLDTLKAVEKILQQRLQDAIESAEVANNRNKSGPRDNARQVNRKPDVTQQTNGSEPNSAVVRPVEIVLQPNGASASDRKRSKVTAERFRRLTNDVQLGKDVMQLLHQAVAMTTGEGRKPKPNETIPAPLCHRSNRLPWKKFDNSITQFALYRERGQQSYVDELIENIAFLPVRRIEEMSDKGTQLKLVLTLSDETKVLFKPMRVSKDVETNPNHFIFNEMERHHSEIAAFHLDRLLDFRRVPPVAGRLLNMTSQIIPYASKHLLKTFFISPVGNICFYGECKYYCDSHHAVCGSPDVIEGSAAVFLPRDHDDDFYPRKTVPNPWAQSYSKRGKLPAWKVREDFCDEVRTTSPYGTGRRLLDLMDLSLFDFLLGNLDRHHYYTFKRYENETYPVLTDNGRGFGRSKIDDIELLAPIYQCCLIRASTLQKVVSFVDALVTDNSATTLSQAMSRSLENDAIKNVLNNQHLAALDRRILKVAIVVHNCLNQTLAAVKSADKSRLYERAIRKVVVDDGF